MTTTQNSSQELNLNSLLRAIDTELAEELRKEQNQVFPALAPVRTREEIGRHICFRLANQHLAVPLSLVVEVGELETVRALPFLPDWTEGVTNIRGEIVSVTNLALFFKLYNRATKKNRTFILLHDNGIKTAIMVDKITGTRLLHREEGVALQTTPSDATSIALADFLQGTAIFLAGEETQELALFDGRKLLAALKLQ
jgi:purine-binding chemotaxis protein CheW